MRAGELRHTVTFERKTKGSDFGGRASAWEPLLEGVPAKVSPLSGRERIAADQVQSQTTHMVTTRWAEELEGVSSADRIKLGDRILEITSVANVDERNVQLDFMCVEAT